MRGLSDGLAALISVQTYDLPAPSLRSSLRHLLAGNFPPGDRLPPPHLILGAGHGTHFGVLAACRARGGRTVVLMKPTIPRQWFDMCVIPKHDRVAPSRQVIVTRGVLNIVGPSGHRQRDHGLILIGGPSATYDWNNTQIAAQVEAIVGVGRSIVWRLTTSRRTPASFMAAIGRLRYRNLRIVRHEMTSSQWVPAQLGKASRAWVTEDSVSMVYEALTSGAAVGILSVPRLRNGRVARGLEELINERWVTRFGRWKKSGVMRHAPIRLDEAGRCAQIVLQRLLADQSFRPGSRDTAMPHRSPARQLPWHTPRPQSWAA